MRLNDVIIDHVSLLFEALLYKDEDRTAELMDCLASIPITQEAVDEVVRACALTIAYLHKIERAWYEINSYREEELQCGDRER